METNSNVENRARIIAKFVLFIGILTGLVLLFVGLFVNKRIIGDIAILYILFGLVTILSSTVFWIFINLVVNISLKLDNKEVVLCEKNLNNLAKILETKSEISKIEVKEIKINDNVNATTEINKTQTYEKIANTATEDEMENIILGEILSGNVQSARYILMTRNGMSLEQAISYIENIDK